MSDAVPAKIQATTRKRATCAGALSGSLAFVIWKNAAALDIDQASALRLAGMSFALSVVAGFLASMIMPLGRIYKTDVVSVTADAGLRSGLIAALVCAGAILAASVAKTFDAPTHAADLNLRALTWHTSFVLFAALISSVPAGVAGSVVGLALRDPHVAGRLIATIIRSGAPAKNATDKPPTDGSIWFIRILAAFSIVGMLSPSLFLLREPKIDPPPVVVPPPPGPPPFLYTKPSSFDYAEPGQFIVAARKTLPAAAADRPLLFSSDSKFFAYCPASSGRGNVTVWNLDTFEEVASFALSTAPNHLTWSPDLSRIFYTTQGNESRMGVLNLQTRSATELPRPKNRDLPDGQPDWWLSSHVALFPADEAPLDLDLDTLLLGRLDEAPASKAADVVGKDIEKSAPLIAGFQMTPNKEPTMNNVRKAPRLEFPKREGWQLTLDVFIQSVQPPPRKEPSQSWNVGGFTTFAFKETGKSAAQWMPQIVIQPGHLVIPSPDGAKMVHHTGSQTEVIYFSTRENVPSVVTITMPLTREKKQNDSDLAVLVKKHDLCAFVYAPMMNPLSGKTIGPDRDHVRAILRILKWDGENADFWAAEQFSDFQTGDVVADFHLWEGGRLTPTTGIADTNWWAPFAGSPRADRDAIPSRVAAEDLDKGMELDLARQTYAFQFQKASHNPHYAKPRERVENPPPVQKLPALEMLKSITELPRPDIPKDAIEKFIIGHHQKATEGRVLGFVSDYDSLVDYLGKYQSRDEIQLAEFDYHQKWNHVTETLQGSMTIAKELPLFAVSYTIKFRTECTSENRWVSGENDIVLSLKETPNGFAIVKQTARIHDRQEGTLRASAPAPAVVPLKKGPPAPVAITVNRPCWTITLPNDQNPSIDMTDAVNIQNGSYELHRTFRQFNEYGQILRSCRFQFRGRVTRQGNTLGLHIDELSWGKDSDREFGKALLPDSDRADGSVLNFVIDGENLIVPGFGKVLRPVR